jgi:hypothetical protein
MSCIFWPNQTQREYDTRQFNIFWLHRFSKMSWRADNQVQWAPPETEWSNATNTPRYGFLRFVFLSSEIGTQIENENAFKINLNCVISDQTWLETRIELSYASDKLTSIFWAYSYSHVISCHLYVYRIGVVLGN